MRVDCLPPASVEVKEEQSYTSTSPLCLHDRLQGELGLYLKIVIFNGKFVDLCHVATRVQAVGVWVCVIFLPY